MWGVINFSFRDAGIPFFMRDALQSKGILQAKKRGNTMLVFRFFLGDVMEFKFPPPITAAY